MPAHLLALSPAAGQSVAAVSKSSSGSSYVFPIVILVAILGFALIRRRRTAQAAASQQVEITEGSMVVTIGGMIATLVERTDDYVVLQLEDGTRARFLPRAVARAWQEPEHEQPATQHDTQHATQHDTQPAVDESADEPPAEPARPPD